MCGIFALLNKYNSENGDIEANFNKGKHRGPDNSTLIKKTESLILGFHRLSINGLDSESNQPITIDGITLICNGEIYNYKELFSDMNINPYTHSDCEIIIHAYKLYGIEYTLNILDGVFAFILYDSNLNNIYVSRDPFGVRPLYILSNDDEIVKEYIYGWLNSHIIAFASEIKQLSNMKKKLDMLNVGVVNIKPVQPGSYIKFNLSLEKKWYLKEKNIYNTLPLSKLIYTSENDIYNGIYTMFTEAVKKRIETTERPIACLLSGGLDSSIVTSIVSKYYNKQLETYSIGLDGSEDLKYAKKVSEFLGTKHTEIIVSEKDFFDAIPEVINMIESYDTTTVRASVGNYLIGKYISLNSDAKVIFNGDGSDELMGGYLYMNHAPNHLEFDKECRRLLTDIHSFDVLRSDRSISTNGLEPRTPFLDRKWVNYYLSISSQIRFDTNKIQEKYLFRKAFDNRNLLPNEILWRRKEAFSDGVSSLNKSWYKIISEKVQDCTIKKKSYEHNNPITLEQMYYREIFEKFYPNLGYIIPYFWMPKYINATDSSARSLIIY
jgi:asparagine synthase (glutamine-hydrolysing)